MGRKSSQEVATRRSDVMDMMMQGKSTLHIIAWVNTNYGTARSTTERDITECKTAIKDYFNQDRDNIIAEHTARYEHIYQQALGSGFHREAMQAMKQKEQLLRLLEEKPVVQIVDKQINLDFSNLSVDEIKILLNKN